MRPRAVTFDLWQTLILDTPAGLRQARAERIRGVEEVLRCQGIPLDPGRVEEAYEGVGTRLESLWAADRDVGSRDQIRWLIEGLGLAGRIPGAGPVMDALEDAYSLPILSALPVANDGAQEALARLRQDGLRLALICNTGRTSGKMLRIVLDRLGLGRYLAVLTFSDEVGLRKPRPEIFQRTLAALGVAPSEAAHVGNDARTDVAGARGAGMRAVHLRSSPGPSQAVDGAETILTLRALPDVLHPCP